MEQAKGRYKMLEPIDKTAKEKYTGMLGEENGKCDLEYMPVVLKGLRIMKQT